MSIFNNNIKNKREFNISAEITFAALLFFIYGIYKTNLPALLITIILAIFGFIHLKKSHKK